MDHQWQKQPNGRADEFAYEYDIHYGPRCVVCGFLFCMGCYPEGWRRECPGPPPEGMEWDWMGDSTTQSPEEEPELRPIR